MEYVHIYTDGGCRGNQEKNNIGAWGVYMTFKEHVKELKGSARNTTNNEMELIGCIAGLQAVKNKKAPTKVYLDSAYVLNGITSWINNWKKNNWKTSTKKPVVNKELWVELDRLKNEFKDIEFIKVKGHAGNFGNEQADRLCNEVMDRMEKI